MELGKRVVVEVAVAEAVHMSVEAAVIGAQRETEGKRRRDVAAEVAVVSSEVGSMGVDLGKCVWDLTRNCTGRERGHVSR